MKITLIIFASSLLFVSCKRKAICSCKGVSTSETYHIEYDDNLPHPMEQCQAIEDNSVDNYNCVYRG